jgi:hypothetical protein
MPFFLGLVSFSTSQKTKYLAHFEFSYPFVRLNRASLRTSGHRKPMEAWNVLLRDHRPGYISWEEFEQNQKMISENAHMQKGMARKRRSDPQARWTMAGPRACQLL